MRFFTTLMASFAVLVMSAQTSFEWAFADESAFNNWVVIDGNNDGSTWAFYSDYYKGESHPTACYKWNSSNKADDWLISPQFKVEQDATYLLTIEYRGGGSSTESMDVYLLEENTLTANRTLVKNFPVITGDPYQTHKSFVNLKAGQQHLAFHATSPANQWRLMVKSVSLTEVSDAKDLELVEITSPLSGANLSQEEVSIKIRNNGTSSFSNVPVSYSINDGEAVSETYTGTIAAGETVSYTFATKADISKTRATYTFTATVNGEGDAIVENNTATAKVYNDGPATIPYSQGFETNEPTEGIVWIDTHNDGSTWGIDVSSGWWSMARTGNACAMVDYSKENPKDDWMILDKINVTEPGYYVLKFWYSGLSGYNERLEVFWGTEQTVEAMTNEIVKYDPFNISKYRESVNVIKIDAPTTLCVGFHAFSEVDKNSILIDDITIDRIENTDIDIAVTAVKHPNDYVRNISSQNVEFTITNNGIATVDNIKVTVKVEGSQIYSAKKTLDAQTSETIVVADILKAISAGTYNIEIAAEVEGDTNTDNNSLTKKFTIVKSDPMCIWDFEDGKLPEDFTFLNTDNGTVNAAMADDVNEDGWGILDIAETHATMGNHTMCGTAWLDGASTAARYCILPKMTVGENGGHFVMTAHSLDARYPQKYSIKVSKSDMDPANWGYSTKLTVEGESIYTTTRGINLSEYAGQEIYVAIVLESKTVDGDLLSVDNLAFYGDVQSSGVETVATDETVAAYMSGDNCIINACEEINTIEVYNVAGALIHSVKNVNATQAVINMEAYPAGVYVVKVDGALVKIMK